MNQYVVVANANQYGPTILKCISGSIPKDISGNYFRNGVGILNYGNQFMQHWFSGDGCILKLGFNKGQCTAQVKMVETALNKRRSQTKSLRDGIIKKLWRKWRQGGQSDNPANTSVLCLKNSPNFLALCQGGEPYVIGKQNLKCQGFSNYGWIKSAFSAHPKVDPDNGDIFNIGMSLPNLNIMRATKDMKKICQNQFKLRQFQSVHDFCLAGKYVVIFQYPVRFSLKDFLWGNKFFFDCKTFDPSLPTLAHIYTKQDLKHIKSIELQPFYCFHFTNGYSDNDKIVIQFVKYDLQSARNLFKLLKDVPNMTQEGFAMSQYKGSSTLEQVIISLEDFSHKFTKSVKINGQFPVCQDSQVGKPWRYSYAVGSQQDNLFKFNTIYKYDRLKQKLDKIYLEGNVYVNEPAIIRTEQNLYLLCVVNREKTSYIEIIQADSLKNICQLQLPEFIPPGYHGKWDSVQ